jgi:hypothetical protein
MSGLAHPRPLGLPHGWPRYVRSAVVHALSLADLVFTRTLSWAPESLNPRFHRGSHLSGPGDQFYPRRSEPVPPIVGMDCQER